MVFGHQVDFTAYPFLNDTSGGIPLHSPITVAPKQLPQFAYLSDYFPHSAKEVRHGSHIPFSEMKGRQHEWMLEVTDVLKLVWFPHSRTIGYEEGAAFTPEQLRFWVYHTFLPLLFQLEQVYHMFHVGSVEIDGKAVIFSAPSFGGKSTLTHYCLQRGHRLLGDDTLAIHTENDGTFRAVASWPFVRPYRQPAVLGDAAEAFVTSPLKIGAVFVLKQVEGNVDIDIAPLKGIAKFKALHAADFSPIGFFKKEHFVFHMQFAKQTPLYEIAVPQNFARLGEVYAAIQDTLLS